MPVKRFYCTKDATMAKGISSGFSGWNGKEDHLPVGVTTSGSYKLRSLVYFSISYAGMTTITDAILYLSDKTTGTNIHSLQTSAPSTLSIQRVTSDWGEGSTDPGEGNWTSTLAWEWDNMYNQNTSSGSNTKAITQGANGNPQSINCLGIVSAWFAGSPNYGILLQNSNESSISKGMQFWSRNIGDTNRPYIEITYTSNTAPSAPTDLIPSQISVGSTVPIISGTRDDPDEGDYISAVQINVHGPTATYKWSTSTTASDPTTGYVRVGTGAQIYASETNKNGGSVTSLLNDLVACNDAYIVARADPARWVRFHSPNSIVDNGTWDTVTFSSKTSSGSLTADEDVFILSDQPATRYWDSGTIGPETGQTTFSVSYGNGANDVTPLVGNVCYIWKARTRDVAGAWGVFSMIQPFKVTNAPDVPTVNVLSSPLDDINDQTPSFYIKHNSSNVADQKMYAYQLIVEMFDSALWSLTGGWDSGNVDLTSTPMETATVDSATLAFGGHYRVRARTQNSSGNWGNFSSGIEFYLHKAQVPTDLAPSSGLTSATPTFTGSVASAADVITAYTIAVYSADLVTTMLSPTRYTTGIIGGGIAFSKVYAGSALSAGSQYVWNVFIETATGDTSETSVNQPFLVADASIPDITAPLGSNGYTITPTITGIRATVFNRFKYEIYPEDSTDYILGTVIYQSASLSSTISGAGPTTFSSVYGGSPALVYGTTYRVRAAVSADAGSSWSSWSGLQTFSTDSASLGSANAPADNAWITTATPGFYINRGASDTIDQMQVRVWATSGTSPIWDSGMTNVTNGTSNVGPITYAGTALIPGTTYKWDFRYQNTTGAISGYSNKVSFRYNGGPNVPIDLYPNPGDTFPDTLFPIFRATFSDPEQTTHGDYPTKWSIRILDGAGSTLATKEITSSLIAGQNQYVWQAADYSLSASTQYQWQTWFTDSKSVVGAISAPAGFVLGVSPNGTITSPTNNSTLSSSTHTITWSYSGGTQMKYRIRIMNTDINGIDGTLRYETAGPFVTSAATSFTIPAGILKDKNYYNIYLYVINTDQLADPSPSHVHVQLLQDAPNPIVGLSITTLPLESRLELHWNSWSTQAGHTFKYYRIERRLVGDQDFTSIGTTSDNQFVDWYAGNDVMYEYRVTVTTSKGGAMLESPDDPDGGNLATGKLVSDTWMFIGNDRSLEHIQELFVNDEDHTRPIQQEAFETLGSNRKVVVRGFVLGNEGNISMTYQGGKLVASPTDEQVFYDETVLGRRLVDYLTFNKGPHVLKSPFGDVWDVEFSSPEYKWLQGGHLQVDLSWVETGQTSRGGGI